MKNLKAILLTILIICPLLISCSNNDDKSVGISKAEQTNKELTVMLYGDDFTINKAITRYKANYPNVKVNLKIINTDEMRYAEFTNKIFTDIMSGKGSDLIFLDTNFLVNSDVYKMMSSGVFANLNELFDNDNDFNIEDFNKTVFDCGVFKGKRYVVPLEYSIPICLSSENIIKETGFNIVNSKDFSSFSAEIEKYLKVNKNNNYAPRVFRLPRTIRDYFNYADIKILDYENNKINLDSPEYKRASEFYKLLYPQESVEMPTNFALWDGCVNLKQKTMIFESYGKSLSFNGFFTESMAVASFDKPVALPIRDIKGGLQAGIPKSIAVRGNSVNIQNAYNFIKIMLCPEIIENNESFNIPIRNSSARVFLNEFTTDKPSYEIPAGLTCKALTQEYCDGYMKITQSISGTYFRTPWSNKLYEAMEPYFKGEKSYEECINNAKDDMEIYLSE